MRAEKESKPNRQAELTVPGQLTQHPGPTLTRHHVRRKYGPHHLAVSRLIRVKFVITKGSNLDQRATEEEGGLVHAVVVVLLHSLTDGCGALGPTR